MPRYNPWAVPNRLVSREVIETWSISKSDRAKPNKTYTSARDNETIKDFLQILATVDDQLRWLFLEGIIGEAVHVIHHSLWYHNHMIFHLLCRRLVIVSNLLTGNGIKRARSESDAKTPTKWKAVYWSWLTNSQQALRNCLWHGTIESCIATRISKSPFKWFFHIPIPFVVSFLSIENKSSRTGCKEHLPLRFCWILMSFAMITVVNYKLTSTQLLHSCCQIVKGCLLYTRIPITWCMYPSTKRRASSDNLVPETDSMHPMIQLHFSIQLRIEPENDRRVSIIVIQLWNFLVRNCSSEIKDIWSGIPGT